MFRRIVSISILGALSVSLLGCGKDGGADLARVKGKVLYNSQPVAGATVNFIASDGNLATGTTDSSGGFTISTGGRPGAALGEHKVTVVKMSASETAGGAAAPTPDDMRKMQMKPGGAAVAAPKSLIPSKYANPKTSGLTALVSGDESKNEFEFPLVD